MIFIFDKDGTLIGNKSNPNRPPNRPEDQYVLPGVAEKISALRAAGHQIAIASNQGGVAWGFLSPEQADVLMNDAAEKIGGVVAWRYCPHDNRAAAKNPTSPYAVECDCRKPKPGMLLSIARQTFHPLDQVVFVGDADSDREAAENAGVKFIWAKEFFDE